MRDNTKWIMLVLTVAFVGWLVFDWVQSRQSSADVGPNPVIAVIDGREVRLSEWNRRVEAEIDGARQRIAGALTDEQVRALRQQAWENMIDSYHSAAGAALPPVVPDGRKIRFRQVPAVLRGPRGGRRTAAADGAVLPGNASTHEAGAPVG